MGHLLVAFFFFFFCSWAKSGLIQFLLSGGKHMQAWPLADEKIARQSFF